MKTPRDPNRRRTKFSSAQCAGVTPIAPTLRPHGVMYHHSRMDVAGMVKKSVQGHEIQTGDPVYAYPFSKSRRLRRFRSRRKRNRTTPKKSLRAGASVPLAAPPRAALTTLPTQAGQIVLIRRSGGVVHFASRSRKHAAPKYRTLHATRTCQHSASISVDYTKRIRRLVKNFDIVWSARSVDVAVVRVVKKALSFHHRRTPMHPARQHPPRLIDHGTSDANVLRRLPRSTGKPRRACFNPSFSRVAKAHQQSKRATPRRCS